VLIIAAKSTLLLVPVVLKRIVDQLALRPSAALLPVALLVSYGARGSARRSSPRCARWCSRA
jgi:predicted naringenin-chalcone synthase